MQDKSLVRLTDQERALCEATVKIEKAKSEKLRRAVISLKADVDGPGYRNRKSPPGLLELIASNGPSTGNSMLKRPAKNGSGFFRKSRLDGALAMRARWVITDDILESIFVMSPLRQMVRSRRDQAPTCCGRSTLNEIHGNSSAHLPLFPHIDIAGAADAGPIRLGGMRNG
jgi:hypothetical protein